MVATAPADLAPFLPFTRRTCDCPVCGGNRDDPAHKGIRCRGGVREGDARYAWCSREEHAGTLTPNANGLYRHFLAGPCRCGQIHPGAPTLALHTAPVRPRPPARSGPPAPITLTTPPPHGELGTPARVFEARTASGALMALHCRFEWAEAGKVKPAKTLRWWRTGWKLDDLAVEDVPLYNLPALAAAAADVPVWLTEGEPACEALQAALTAAGLSAIVLATYGATAIPSDAQLRELVGRLVTLWPDPDADGEKWRDTLTEKLGALGISVRVCVWPDAPPKGDAVEYFASGGTVAGLLALTAPACVTHADATQADPPPAEGWEARARHLEQKIVETRDLIANPHLEASEKIVKWRVDYELEHRGVCGAHTIPITAHDYKTREGVERKGWAHNVGLSAGTTLRILHNLDEMGGIALKSKPTFDDVTHARHDHLEFGRAPQLVSVRELGADRVRTPRGGARKGAGRPPNVCGNCGGMNLQERTIRETVKRTIRETLCPDCHDTHREPVGPERVIARQVTEESAEMPPVFNFDAQGKTPDPEVFNFDAQGAGSVDPESVCSVAGCTADLEHWGADDRPYCKAHDPWREAS